MRLCGQLREMAWGRAVCAVLLLPVALLLVLLVAIVLAVSILSMANRGHRDHYDSVQLDDVLVRLSAPDEPILGVRTYVVRLHRPGVDLARNDAVLLSFESSELIREPSMQVTGAGLSIVADSVRSVAYRRHEVRSSVGRYEVVLIQRTGISGQGPRAPP